MQRIGADVRDAGVEQLGKPTGSTAKTWAAIEKPPDPPAASTPSTRPRGQVRDHPGRATAR